MTITRKYHYVYITTNKINGKQYVGEHSTRNIDDRYIGSGDMLRDAIKKYGKFNFERRILERFMLKVDAYNAQSKYILQYNTFSPNGYNISPTGGLRVSGCFSEDSKALMSIKAIERFKNPEERRKTSEGTKRGMANMDKDKKDQMVENIRQVQLIKWTPEKKERHREVCRQAKLSMSTEAKAHHKEALREAALKQWQTMREKMIASIDIEERRSIKQEFWNNISPEGKKQIGDKVSVTKQALKKNKAA
jgi:hypothetical protein